MSLVYYKINAVLEGKKYFFHLLKLASLRDLGKKIQVEVVFVSRLENTNLCKGCQQQKRLI
jgi:hypothetical protein